MRREESTRQKHRRPLSLCVHRVVPPADSPLFCPSCNVKAACHCAGSACVPRSPPATSTNKENAEPSKNAHRQSFLLRSHFTTLTFSAKPLNNRHNEGDGYKENKRLVPVRNHIASQGELTAAMFLPKE